MLPVTRTGLTYDLGVPATGSRSTSATRVTSSLALVAFALASSYAAVIVVLLPNQVALLDPESKVTNLAIVSTVSFAFTIVAQPLVGAFSDRTHSPLGRRAPWMIGGALSAAVALLCLGGASSLVALGALWVLAQFSLNALDIASSAVVPDEIPPARRGRTFAVIGTGATVGGAVAVVLAGRHADDPQVVCAALGLLLLVATASFVLLARVRDARVGARERGTGLSLRSFLVSPATEPEFVRVFGSRFLFVLAYYLVYAYQLFILTDHLGLSTDRANEVVGSLTVLGLTAVLVGIVLTGWWSDRVGNRPRFMVAACGLLALGLLVPLVLPSVTGMAVFAGLRGLAFGIHLAASSALITEVLPGGGLSAGKDLGIYNVATNIPQAVAPALAALVIGHLGGYPALFVAACVVAVLALLLTTRIRAVVTGAGGVAAASSGRMPSR